MTNQVKRCAQCGTENPASEVLCQKCGVMLPFQTHDPGYQAPPRPKPARPIEPEPAPTLPPPILLPPSSEKNNSEPLPVRLYTEGGSPIRIIVSGLDIGFMDLMWLLVKLLLASIPALILATVIVTALVVIPGSAITSYQHYSHQKVTP